MADELNSDVAVTPVAAQNEPSRRVPGKLRIFLGMAPGVGKTRALLQAAQKERLAGRGVVIACLHDRCVAASGNLTKGLPPISPPPQTDHSVPSAELDVNAVLSHRPDVAVVDRLARDNGHNCAHAKRYQDVQQLLEAGIDVFTTLNVGQVESWTAEVCRVTGEAPGTVVPKAILKNAEIELVDSAPGELINRIRRGEVCFAAALSGSGPLDEERLMLLRELTARLFAEQLADNLKQRLPQTHLAAPVPSGQRFLAVVRANLDSEPIVRWTSNLANSFRAHWIVLYVETSQSMSGEAASEITRILALAREWGAEVITTADHDPVAATLRVAAQRNVTQMIVGKVAEPSRWNLRRADTFVLELLRRTEGIGVQVMPIAGTQATMGLIGRSRTRGNAFAQYLKALSVIAVVTVAAFLFAPIVGAHATALIFLLTVVLLALFVERGPTLAAAAVSALLWEFFFLPPVFAFRINHFEDTMLFGMYFVVALVLGHLTTRIRSQEEAERERETRATALYLLTRDLNEAAGLDQMVQRIVQHLESCFKAQIAVVLPERDTGINVCPGSTLQITESELQIAQWVLHYGQRAGRFTNHSPSASALYVPLLTSSGVVGVLGLSINQFNIHQENLMEAFSQQIAMAIDRHRLNGISEKAKLLAESERLSKTLLDSMSHEIRTPIAVIESATSNLAELQDGDAKTRQEMVAEIREATGRLNRLVGNVLEASRLESGAVKPRLNECDVKELIHVVLEGAEKELSNHKVAVNIVPELPVVAMDFVMMQQALANLVSNSVFHTPAGTAIEISARMESEDLLLTVADRGPGILSDYLPRIFEKFFRVPNSRTGGTGLGLSLVKGFVEAQGGKVTVENRAGGGVAFTIRLPRLNPNLLSQETEV